MPSAGADLSSDSDSYSDEYSDSNYSDDGYSSGSRHFLDDDTDPSEGNVMQSFHGDFTRARTQVSAPPPSSTVMIQAPAMAPRPPSTQSTDHDVMPEDTLQLLHLPQVLVTRSSRTAAKPQAQLAGTHAFLLDHLLLSQFFFAFTSNARRSIVPAFA